MKLSHQERIMDVALEKQHKTEWESSNYMFHAIRDCFAISRLETEANGLYKVAMFNEKPRIRLEEINKETDDILSKYGIATEKEEE